MEILKKIAEGLYQGDKELVHKLVKEAINAGIPSQDILNQGLIVGMNTVGEQFRIHEIFLPEVLLAAQAMNAGMSLIKPLLIKQGVPIIGKVILGTVQGDIHDIGKNLVGIMLAGAGFEVIDLGIDVPPEKFVKTAVNEKADIIGMSTLLTTTMPVMKQIVELVKAKGLTGRIKTIIGGAPVSDEYAKIIGADAYGYDAVNAVEQVKRLLKE